jgi:hypothetical protein
LVVAHNEKEAMQFKILTTSKVQHRDKVMDHIWEQILLANMVIITKNNPLMVNRIRSMVESTKVVVLPPNIVVIVDLITLQLKNLTSRIHSLTIKKIEALVEQVDTLEVTFQQEEVPHQVQ